MNDNDECRNDELDAMRRTRQSLPADWLNNLGRFAVLQECFNDTSSWRSFAHQALVWPGNIANIDTPGYRTRDLDSRMFENQLQEAIDARGIASKVPPGRWMPARRATSPTFATALRPIVCHDQTQCGHRAASHEMLEEPNAAQHGHTIIANQFQLLGAAISESA